MISSHNINTARTIIPKKKQKKCAIVRARFAFAVMLPLILLSATACANSEPIVDEDGVPIMYEQKELSTGIYIQFENGYRRALPIGMTFNGAADEEDGSRMVWLTNKAEGLIPEVGANEKIIVISANKPEAEVYLEHFADNGYTMGALFRVDTETGIISFPTSDSDLCEGSSIKAAVDDMVDSPRQTTITELGVASDINAPFSNGLLSDKGYIKGLSENATYKIGFYEGTSYRYFYARSDTHVYLQDGSYASVSYTPTKEGYFYIDLPDALPSGLYCIDGVGIFNYTAGYAPSTTGKAETDDSPIPSSTLAPDESQIKDTIGGGAAQYPSTSAQMPTALPTTPAPAITAQISTPVPTAQPAATATQGISAPTPTPMRGISAPTPTPTPTPNGSTPIIIVPPSVIKPITSIPPEAPDVFEPQPYVTPDIRELTPQ